MNKQLKFPEAVLKGFGQIMFQENAFTGLLFLIGIFIGAWQYGLAALVATVSGTLFAHLLRFDREEIQSGLYGFSAALVGVVLAFKFELNFLNLAAIIGGALAAWIQHLFIRFQVPGFTFPFILVAWIFIFINGQLNLLSAVTYDSPTSSIDSSHFLLSGSNGYGQVIFQGSLISGLLFLIGVGIHSKTSAVIGLLASFIGALIAWILGESQDLILSGLFGFNTLLTAIALSANWQKDKYWLILGVILTIFIHIGLLHSHWLDSMGGVLTFPFVLATWIVLGLKRVVK